MPPQLRATLLQSLYNLSLMNSATDILRRGPALDAWLFYAGRFVRDGARSLMAVLAVIYLVEIGFSNAQVGIIFGCSLAGGFVVSVGVMLTSRVIPTRIWSIANMLILAVGGIVLILSNDFWFLILGGFFGAYAASGAHWGGMMQLEQTGIAAAIPQERRTRAYSNLSIGSSAGRAIGALLAGLSTLLIETFNWEPIAAYQAVLWLYVGLNVLAAAVYTLLSNAVNTQLSPSPCSAVGESKRRALFANPFKAKARRPILTMSSLFAFDSFAGGMVFDSFLSFWLFTKFDMSAAAIGAVLVAGQVLNMVSLVVAPWLAERIGLLNTLVFTQIFSNIMLILFAFAPSAIIAVTIWMFRVDRRRNGRSDTPGIHDGNHRTSRTSDHGRNRQLRTRTRSYPQRDCNRLALVRVLNCRPMDCCGIHQTRLRSRHLARLPTSEGLKYDDRYASR